MKSKVAGVETQFPLAFMKVNSIGVLILNHTVFAMLQFKLGKAWLQARQTPNIHCFCCGP